MPNKSTAPRVPVPPPAQARGPNQSKPKYQASIGQVRQLAHALKAR